MEPRQIPASIHGFSPLFDQVTEECGTMASVVFAVIYRHCEMRDQVCHASAQRLMSIIGVARSTLQRHIKSLLDAGFLEEAGAPPGKTNRYKATGKVEFGITSGVVTKTRGGGHKDQGGVVTKTTKDTKEKIQEKRKTPPTPSDDVDAIFDLYAMLCKSLPKVQVRTDLRRKGIAKALKEDPDTNWGALFHKIESNPFLRGESENGSRWSGATIDWIFCRKDARENRAKILEGHYDNSGKSNWDGKAWAAKGDK